MNTMEALKDRSLLGAPPVFADLTTWNPWLVFLPAVYGLPLDPECVDLFGLGTRSPSPFARKNRCRLMGLPRSAQCYSL